MVYIILFSRYNEILTENCEFFSPHLFNAPIKWVPMEFWAKETRLMGLPEQEKSVISSAISIQ